MNSTKEKKEKSQITSAILVLTVILLVEIYFMINFPTSYIPIVLMGVVALAAVYVVINTIMTFYAEKETVRNEHFENLYRSEKASYIMLKKSFDEIEEKLGEFQEIFKVPAEEIINAQKGFSKVIINRSKENADAIINSNDQVLERLDKVEEIQNERLQDLIVQLKDIEERLNQAIISGNQVVIQETSFEDNLPTTDDLLLEADEVQTVDDSIVGETETVDEIELVSEPVVEEVPEMPDLSDPNKPMSPDDIAALFANMAGGDIPVEEVAQVEEEMISTEEKPPMPDLSDPNKPMSPEEIAALIANL